MPAGLRVLAPGLHTTVQDLGRTGYQDIGVPVSGALDGFSLRLANALVGNLPGMAALEILLGGPTLEVSADAVRVALAGPGASLEICGEKPRIVPGAESITLSRGEVFRVLVGRQSACCYLAVAGGLAVPLVLGSASTYVRAAIGGIEGRLLRRDDIVPLANARPLERGELRLPTPTVAPDQPIRVVLGPQKEYFTDEAVAALLGAEFRVSQSADRMGMRLDGPLLSHRHGWDIISDAIPTGAIQVPGSGQPIVLLADHQTTGGYPKIATVVSADLPVVGRRRPGDTLRFIAVSVEAAEELCRDEQGRLSALLAALEPVSEDCNIDLGSLYGENLISGVTNGVEYP
jgi:allophanate hydrolase